MNKRPQEAMTRIGNLVFNKHGSKKGRRSLDEDKEIYRSFRDKKSLEDKKVTRDFYMNHVRKGTQNIKRFGMEDVIKPQNLADHGYQVMNLFLIACDFMAYRPTVNELDKVLNHDVIETLTGDLNKAVKEKNQITKEAWEDIEKEMLEHGPPPRFPK